ncbi:hypothetical protein ACYSUO_13675 [Streptomyces sp. UC4497]
MVINAQGNNEAHSTEPGTALLLAAAPVGKAGLIDAVSVLPTLAAVPPSVLTGTAAASVVELADPLDPQAVLTRLRTVAAQPGPLHLYLAGQLHLDQRQRLLHLALARTTPSTLRYTALPWHWLTGELTLRRPHTTTVVLDLVADAEAWKHVGVGGLGLGHGTNVFGRVLPPPPRRTTLTPTYLRAYADIWRTGARPTPPDLHETAASHAGPKDALFVALGSGYVPPGTPSGGREPAPATGTGHAPGAGGPIEATPSGRPTGAEAAETPAATPPRSATIPAPTSTPPAGQPAAAPLPAAGQPAASAPVPSAGEPAAASPPPAVPAAGPASGSVPGQGPSVASAGDSVTSPAAHPVPVPDSAQDQLSNPGAPLAVAVGAAPASAPPSAAGGTATSGPSAASVSASPPISAAQPAPGPEPVQVPASNSGSAPAAVPAPSPVSAPASVAAPASAQPSGPGAPPTPAPASAVGAASASQPNPTAVAAPAPADASVSGHAHGADTVAAPAASHAQAPTSAPAPAVQLAKAPAPSQVTPAPVPAPVSPEPAPVPAAPTPSPAPVSAPAAPAPVPPNPVAPPAPAPAAPAIPPMPATAPAAPAQPTAPDPHALLLAAVQAGRHGEAASIAAAWEGEALRVHGMRSSQVVHWMEVRADLARLADEPGRSCELWIAVAHARIARGESPSDEDVEAAVDRAHHQWEQVSDPDRARGHAAGLTALREQVPGRRPGALDAIKRRLDALSDPTRRA